MNLLSANYGVNLNVIMNEMRRIGAIFGRSAHLSFYSHFYLHWNIHSKWRKHYEWYATKLDVLDEKKTKQTQIQNHTWSRSFCCFFAKEKKKTTTWHSVWFPYGDYLQFFVSLSFHDASLCLVVVVVVLIFCIVVWWFIDLVISKSGIHCFFFFVHEFQEPEIRRRKKQQQRQYESMFHSPRSLH